jgi:hypothetical protein
MEEGVEHLMNVSYESTDLSMSPSMVRVTAPACQQNNSPVKSQSQPINARTFYLITYSQVDEDLCPSREAFADIVSSEFSAKDTEAGRDSNVVHWACAKEPHTEGGFHYHLSIRLRQRRRFKDIANSIQRKYSIRCDFQEGYTVYHDAFTYVTKQDTNYITSPDHPSLENSPLTKNAIAANKRRSESNQRDGGRKAKGKEPRLDREHFYQIVIHNNIKTDLELCNLAHLQYNEGKKDLHRFVISMPERKRIELLTTSWKIQTAGETLARQKKTRIELLYEALDGPHNNGCTGEWLDAANEIIANNDQIERHEFVSAILELLDKGRGKFRNVMCYGPSNCGKTFIIYALTVIYHTFISPAEGTNFNWVGAPSKEVILLNDLNYSEDVLPWGTMLNLLEGKPIHVSAPKNHFQEDILWTALQPIFATCEAPISRIVGGALNVKQTKMMSNRWNAFEFTHVMDDSRDIPTCGKCFAQFLLT